MRAERLFSDCSLGRGGNRVAVSSEIAVNFLDEGNEVLSSLLDHFVGDEKFEFTVRNVDGNQIALFDEPDESSRLLPSLVPLRFSCLS